MIKYDRQVSCEETSRFSDAFVLQLKVPAKKRHFPRFFSQSYCSFVTVEYQRASNKHEPLGSGDWVTTPPTLPTQNKLYCKQFESDIKPGWKADEVSMKACKIIRSFSQEIYAKFQA